MPCAVFGVCCSTSWPGWIPSHCITLTFATWANPHRSYFSHFATWVVSLALYILRTLQPGWITLRLILSALHDLGGSPCIVFPPHFTTWADPLVSYHLQTLRQWVTCKNDWFPLRFGIGSFAPKVPQVSVPQVVCPVWVLVSKIILAYKENKPPLCYCLFVFQGAELHCIQNRLCFPPNLGISFLAGSSTAEVLLFRFSHLHK